MSERDPRKEPRPGDVVRKGQITRTVTEFDQNNVRYRSSVRSMIGFCWITTWQTWAAGAEVIDRGEG